MTLARFRCGCGRRMGREPNEPNRDAKKKARRQGAVLCITGNPLRVSRQLLTHKRTAKGVWRFANVV
jgi:hypothetical protein